MGGGGGARKGVCVGRVCTCVYGAWVWECAHVSVCVCARARARVCVTNHGALYYRKFTRAQASHARTLRLILSSNLLCGPSVVTFHSHCPGLSSVSHLRGLYDFYATEHNTEILAPLFPLR